MKKIYRIIVCCVVSVLLGRAGIYAGSFKILGTRPAGMGGAFVSVAEGPNVAYWNPAGLAQKEFRALSGKYGLGFPVGVNLEATGGILNSAKKISDSAAAITKLKEAQEKGTSVGLNDLKVFSQALTNLKELEGEGKGIQADLTGGVGVKIGQWSVSVNNFSSLGINPLVDLSGIYLGSATISGAPSFPAIPSRYAISSEELSGIDLSKLKDDYATLFSTETPSGLSGESTSLSDSIDTLASSLGVKITGYTPQQIANALINIAKSQGITDDEIKNAVSQISDAIPLLQQLISGKTFTENNSNLAVKGITMTELVFSHGRYLPETEKFPFLKDIAVGLNIKYISAQTAYLKEYFLKGETTELSEFSSLINKNTASSSALALDLGLLWHRDDFLFKPSAGLLARNINSPRFKMPEAALADGIETYSLDAQTRAGISIKPFNWWLIALDMDLTENKTEIEGYNSRNFSVGSEVNLVNSRAFNMALRGGVIKNTAFSGAPLTYTTGVGFNLFGFNLDISGAMSSDKVLIPVNDSSTQEIPSRAMLSMSLSFIF